MAYSIITQPNNNMGAYSTVPLKIYDDGFNDVDNFKYIVNICYDKVTITGSTEYTILNNIYTKLTSSTSHNYTIGDYVFLNDINNNNLYTGYYIIKKIISTTEFIIDLDPSEPFGVNTFTTQKFIKYNMNPDIEGYCKMDLSNVLKDFVTQNLSGSSQNYSLVYNGTDTRFEYELICGAEKKYQLRFDDNIFSGGSLGFIFTGITSMTNIPFQPGDSVYIEQDLYGWSYNDNYFDSGVVCYSGSTNVPFRVGYSINVTGQEYFPYYNGPTSVLGIIGSNKILKTPKYWQGSTPVDGGVIYGIPRPEYNGTCNIVSLGIDPILGYLVVITDKSFTDSSPQLPGTISFASGNKKIITYNDLTISGLSVYNSHLNRNEYSLTKYDEYIIKNGSANNNNISTTFRGNDKYRVETNTIGFLLGHKQNDGITCGIGYEFFNSSNTLLGKLQYTGLTKDFYLPIGLNQISTLSTFNYGTSFSTYSGDVTNYKICITDGNTGSFTPKSNKINFELNTDCSKYEVYHIMWKDKLGSFVSYPFIYISRDNIQVDRKTYYRQDGNWDNNSFGYKDYERGETTFYSRSRKSVILNSGWLYEFERDLMEDLIQSPSVYLQTPDNRLYGGNLEETKIELFKKDNDDLFSYSFNFIYSTNEYRF